MKNEQRWANPTLIGAQVRLVSIDGSHAPGMWEMVNDPIGAKFTATTATFTREQIDKWCASRPDQTDRIDLAIIEVVSDEFVGEVVLNHFDPITDFLGFRISLRAPRVYGKGFGTEATQLLTTHALDVMGLAGLRLEVLSSNERAIRLYSKIGFTPTRRFSDSDLEWLEMELHAADDSGAT